MTARQVGRDLCVRHGRVVTSSGVAEQEVLILGGRVQQLGRRVQAPAGCPDLEARGMLVMPAGIDTQVHFREPGLEHKEDLGSGSLAAVAGGIGAFCEMPNTQPPTADPDALADKIRRAAGRSWADFAFFLGATADLADRLGDWESLPGCAGIKVFMGSSTGNLLIPDDATLERVMRSGTRRIAVHSEDEPRLRQRYAALDGRGEVSVAEHPDVRDVEVAVRATTRLLDLAEKTGRRVHLLHVSTAEEVAILRERALGDLVTAEVTPNHLFLVAPDCYERFGTRAQMNPPVRDLRHRDALRQGLVDRVLSVVGSDHAPHSLEEKARPYPRSPSGIPGVQTTLPLLLTAVRDGWLRLEDIAQVLSANPARTYGIERKGGLEPGDDGDLTVVDPSITEHLPLDRLRSRAGWSPFAGIELAGWPVVTVLRGMVVFRDGAPVGEPSGAPMTFA